MVVDKLQQVITILEVSVAHASGLQNQWDIKYNRYCVNSTELDDESKPPYPAGVNLVNDLRQTHKMRVVFKPIVVGSCGEHLPRTRNDLKGTLGLKVAEVDALLERLSRSAVIGTSRVVSSHMAN